MMVQQPREHKNGILNQKLLEFNGVKEAGHMTAWNTRRHVLQLVFYQAILAA
jgi:hypothetical protein